jgi:PAS domain S-box-containing protein
MGELPIGSEGPSISDDSVHDQHPILTSIEQRLGVLPNFFRLTSASPEITASLWGFAQFAYLDNPLPSLFKERLFVFLSRFCEIRYCVTRHLGFLIGLGRPAGDANVGTQTIDEALRLLCRNLPRGIHVDSHIDRCVTLQSPIDDMPAVESELEEAIFICAAHVFLHTSDAARSLAALKQALGSRFEHLTVFLTFVRSAHQWTQMHPELELEEDMKQILAADQILAQRLLNDPEVMSCQKTSELMHELETLRDNKRRDAELTRLAAEFQFLKQAIDASSIVAMTDAKGTITYANDKFCEISGFSRQELVGQNHRIINSGLHSREFFRDMYRTISHGNVWRGDIRNRRKDGSYYWVDTTIVPEMSSDGKSLRYVTIRNEITLRKQTENALRESESRFRMMADGLPLIVWVHDAEGNLEFVNQAFCSFFGVTHQRMRGGEWKALLHPEDAEAYANEFARCVREQCYFNAAVRVRVFTISGVGSRRGPRRVVRNQASFSGSSARVRTLQIASLRRRRCARAINAKMSFWQPFRTNFAIPWRRSCPV